MLVRRARAYSSYCSHVVLVYLYPFRLNQFSAAENHKKKLLKPLFLEFKVIQDYRC